MFFNPSTIILAFFSITASAQILDRSFAGKRSVNANGGYSLVGTAGCPVDTTQYFNTWCCPNSLTYVSSGGTELCCPGANDCTSTLQANPACADSTWSLWNTTESQYGFFCCIVDAIGLTTGGCVALGTAIGPGEEAVLITLGIGGGSQSTGSSTSTTSSGSGQGATVTGSSETKSASATGTGQGGTSGSATATATGTGTSSSASGSSTGKSEGTNTFGNGVGQWIFAPVIGAVFAAGVL